MQVLYPWVNSILPLPRNNIVNASQNKIPVNNVTIVYLIDFNSSQQ